MLQGYHRAIAGPLRRPTVSPEWSRVTSNIYIYTYMCTCSPFPPTYHSRFTPPPPGCGTPGVPFEQVDGSDGATRELRNTLWTVSGHRGKYPQVGAIKNDQWKKRKKIKMKHEKNEKNEKMKNEKRRNKKTKKWKWKRKTNKTGHWPTECIIFYVLDCWLRGGVRTAVVSSLAYPDLEALASPVHLRNTAANNAGDRRIVEVSPDQAFIVIITRRKA